VPKFHTNAYSQCHDWKSCNENFGVKVIQSLRSTLLFPTFVFIAHTTFPKFELKFFFFKVLKSIKPLALFFRATYIDSVEEEEEEENASLIQSTILVP
jgi:hypothetical protein